MPFTHPAIHEFVLEAAFPENKKAVASAWQGIFDPIPLSTIAFACAVVCAFTYLYVLYAHLQALPAILLYTRVFLWPSPGAIL